MLSRRTRRTRSWEEVESEQERVQLMDEFLRWLEGMAASPALPALFCSGRLKLKLKLKLMRVWSPNLSPNPNPPCTACTARSRKQARGEGAYA